MVQNTRLNYPLQAVGFARVGVPHNSTGYTAAKGVQSLGGSTNFSLEQAYQLGQLEIYQNIEDIPDVEITIDKVIDGKPLLQHLATPAATASSLAGRYNENRCMVAFSYYAGDLSFATGIPLTTVVMSSMYVSSIAFAIPVEGNSTETITLVGNDKRYFYSPAGAVPWTTGTQFNGSESPLGSGISRRQNVIMASSYWPTEIPGISGDGRNPVLTDGQFGAHVQTVNVSVQLARTELFELGRKNPYFRYAEFPTEVTCSIEITSTEEGEGIDANSTVDNLTDQRIYIYLGHGIVLDLGTKNKLSSVDFTGGDTSGGNVTLTYNYSNFNDLKVLHFGPNGDPAGLTS